MAKLLVVHDDDPGLAVTFEYIEPGHPTKAQGWRGTCTECGTNWVMHRWNQDKALEAGINHVDNHEL